VGSAAESRSWATRAVCHVQLTSALDLGDRTRLRGFDLGSPAHQLTEVGMKTRVMYCSACDREVTVLTTSDESKDETLTGATCTEMGKSCTGTLCPICAVAAKESDRK
jgi:hypothetical protein